LEFHFGHGWRGLHFTKKAREKSAQSVKFASKKNNSAIDIFHKSADVIRVAPVFAGGAKVCKFAAFALRNL
jgi:hypothetical protein